MRRGPTSLARRPERCTSPGSPMTSRARAARVAPTHSAVPWSARLWTATCRSRSSTSRWLESSIRSSGSGCSAATTPRRRRRARTQAASAAIGAARRCSRRAQPVRSGRRRAMRRSWSGWPRKAPRFSRTTATFCRSPIRICPAASSSPDQARTTPSPTRPPRPRRASSDVTRSTPCSNSKGSAATQRRSSSSPRTTPTGLRCRPRRCRRPRTRADSAA